MNCQDDPYLRSFGCGVLILDAEGRITFANPVARKILALADKDLLQPYALPHPWRTARADGGALTAAEHPFTRVLAGERVNGEEFQLELRDGSRLVVYMNGAPLRGADGRVEGGIFDLNDITAKNNLLREIRDANARLEKSEARLRAVMGSIDEILFELDEHGTYLHVWAGNEALLARPPAQMIGRTVAEVAGEELARRTVEAIRRVQETGAAENFEYPLDVPQGRCWFLARIAQIPGTPAAYIFLARDITTRKKMEEDLRRTEETLRRSDQSKSEFISIAAHELRTPLTSILGYASLLLNAESYGGFTPAQERDFLAQIEEKALDLTGTISEMLDISRIEAGQPIPLELRPGVLQEVLEKTLQNFQMQQVRHRFELHLNSPVPLTVRIDRHKMVQVMENLLSNAVKFSPSDTVVRVTGRAADDGYVVAVTDEGVGMTEEEQSRIFDKFYRADTSDTAAGGLGLGMSIVRGIIQAHHGRIWVESASGRGTTVQFFLPALPPPAPDADEAAR